MTSAFVCLLDAGQYKSGDDPPAGYLQWHEWAKVQAAAGLRQVTCGQCSKLKFPQELSGKVIKSKIMMSAGVIFETESPLCKSCLEVRTKTKKPHAEPQSRREKNSATLRENSKTVTEIR